MKLVNFRDFTNKVVLAFSVKTPFRMECFNLGMNCSITSSDIGRYLWYFDDGNEVLKSILLPWSPFFLLGMAKFYLLDKHRVRRADS